jgi:hypothetical protein
VAVFQGNVSVLRSVVTGNVFGFCSISGSNSTLNVESSMAAKFE